MAENKHKQDAKPEAPEPNKDEAGEESTGNLTRDQLIKSITANLVESGKPEAEARGRARKRAFEMIPA